MGLGMESFRFWVSEALEQLWVLRVLVGKRDF